MKKTTYSSCFDPLKCIFNINSFPHLSFHFSFQVSIPQLINEKTLSHFNLTRVLILIRCRLSNFVLTFNSLQSPLNRVLFIFNRFVQILHSSFLIFQFLPNILHSMLNQPTNLTLTFISPLSTFLLRIFPALVVLVFWTSDSNNYDLFFRLSSILFDIIFILIKSCLIQSFIYR